MTSSGVKALFVSVRGAGACAARGQGSSEDRTQAAGHHRGSRAQCISASLSGRSPWGPSPKQAAIPQRHCGRALGRLHGRSVPGASLSPCQSRYVSFPQTPSVPPPAGTSPSAGRPSPPPALQEDPLRSGRQGNSPFLLLPEAQELCCPPADQGSPSQRPHCLAAFCKSSADCSAPRCGW